MDDLIAALVILTIAGAVICIAQFLVVLALIFIGILTIILLPFLIRGFVREIRRPQVRREDDH